MSLRNAFCACTGLPTRDPELIFNSDQLTPERLITSVVDLPLTAPLSEQFQYSNQMFGIGGYAAAVAAEPAESDLSPPTSPRWATSARPLGMDRSTFALDEVLAIADYGQPHGLDLAGEYHIAKLEDDERYVLTVAPAGAPWSNATEMASYIQMELAGGILLDGTRASLRRTWTRPGNHRAMPALAALDVPPEMAMAQGYALGWVDGDYHGQRLLSHSGGPFGFSAQVALLPDAGLGLVILTNGASADFFKLAVQFRLFELVFDQPATVDPLVRGAIAASAQQSAELQRQLGDVDPAAVAPYLGRYRHDVLGEVEIAMSDGTRILDAGGLHAEFQPLRNVGPEETTYLTSDLSLTGVATMAFSDETVGQSDVHRSIDRGGVRLHERGLTAGHPSRYSTI